MSNFEVNRTWLGFRVYGLQILKPHNLLIKGIRRLHRDYVIRVPLPNSLLVLILMGCLFRDLGFRGCLLKARKSQVSLFQVRWPPLLSEIWAHELHWDGVGVEKIMETAIA